MTLHHLLSLYALLITDSEKFTVGFADEVRSIMEGSC